MRSRHHDEQALYYRRAEILSALKAVPMDCTPQASAARDVAEVELSVISQELQRIEVAR